MDKYVLNKFNKKDQKEIKSTLLKAKEAYKKTNPMLISQAGFVIKLLLFDIFLLCR